MTNEEYINRLEQIVRDHKAQGHSSNITLKVNQVEFLLSAAREAKPTAEIVDFNIAAEIRREDTASERRYTQRWANWSRQQRFAKEARERLDKRKQRKSELIEKWKNYGGNLVFKNTA